MANEKTARAGSGATTYLITTLAVLLIFALMGWLYVQQRGDEATAVAEGDSAAVAGQAVAGPAPSQVVNSTQFEQDVKDYVGQVIELTDARFQASLSAQTFWIELPTGAPYLVKLDSALVAAGVTAPSSGTLDIIGTVKEKDAALVGQWLASGVLTSEDQQMQAEFGTTYLEARQIRPAGQ